VVSNIDLPANFDEIVKVASKAMYDQAVAAAKLKVGQIELPTERIVKVFRAARDKFSSSRLTVRRPDGAKTSSNPSISNRNRPVLFLTACDDFQRIVRRWPL